MDHGALGMGTWFPWCTTVHSLGTADLYYRLKLCSWVGIRSVLNTPVELYICCNSLTVKTIQYHIYSKSLF